MTTNTITQLSDPQGFSPDPLTDLLRSGAQRLIQQAVEAELAALLEAHASDKTDDGRARLVRHGHLPEREIMTGIGAVPVQVPRVRDRGDGEEKIRFTSMILPPYLRKAKSIEELLPGSISKAFPPATFTRHSRLFSARTRRGCLRPRYRASKLIGGMSTTAGSAATSAPVGSSMFGRMVFTSDQEWLRKNNVFWWSLAQMNGGAKR